MGTSNLMEQILNRDNLNATYLQVMRRRVGTPKPDGGVKNLRVPIITDRFVQQAIAQVLTPVYKEQLHNHSYGLRPNGCAQQAVITELDKMNDGYDWTVGIDLEKFFGTINHDKLVTLMGRTVRDGEVMSVIRKFPTSGIKGDDEYRKSVVGARQGDNLSPLLANITQNELDKEVEQRGLSFAKYTDDRINTVGDEMSAKGVVRNITQFIEGKLGLEVNIIESKVDKSQGIKYLECEFYLNSRAYQRKAKPHAKPAARSKTRVKQLTRRGWRIGNIYKVQKLNKLIRGWVNYYKIGSMRPVCARLDGSTQYRMRMCIWKHRETPQNRARNLKKLGVPG